MGLNVTSLIYNGSGKGIFVTTDNPNVYPVLSKNEIKNLDGGDNSNFVVTPPLFRLDANQKSKVKIVAKENNFPKDKGSMYWFCSTGIPPEPDEEWAKDYKENDNKASLDVKVRMSQCIKLIVRPDALSTNGAQESVEKIKWEIRGDALTAVNDSAYFVNLKTIRVGNTDLKGVDFVAPYSRGEFKLPTALTASEPVSWVAVNDLGGETKMYTNK